MPESENIFLKFISYNENGGVHLIGMASLNEDFSNAYGLIDFLDGSPNAILTGGSVGYRAFGVGTSNWDNLTVTAFTPPVPEPASLMLLGLAGAGLLRRRRHA